MTHVRAILLLLVLALGCRKPPVVAPMLPVQRDAPDVSVLSATQQPAPLPPPLPQPAILQPLDVRLTADIGRGGTVLLDLREDGVWAKSVDGVRKERLVQTDATWLWPDAQTRVLWLWRELGGELQALDLAAPLPEPVTVAIGVPAGLGWQWTKRTVAGPDDARLRLSLDPHDPGFQFGLPPEPGHWNAPRRWKACAHSKNPRALAICPKLAPGAEALLHAWSERLVGKETVAQLGHANAPVSGCSSETCGVAHAMGATHWWLVPAAVWTDCCRRGNQLYDPRTRRFLRLGSGKMLPGPSGDRRDTVEFLWLCPQNDVIVTESGVVPLEPPGALRFGDADACLGGLPLRTPNQPCPQGDQCEEEPPDAATDVQ